MKDCMKKQPRYFAHTGLCADQSDWQTLSDHLTQVAAIALKNAGYFPSPVWAEVAGLLHDLGKYTREFQARLEGASQRVDHATAGAQVAFDRWGMMGKMLAFCIAGHHAGLANGVDDGKNRSTLQVRLSPAYLSRIPDLDSQWKTEITLPERLNSPAAFLNRRMGFEGFQLAFFIRMIFSCLVDADYVDTDCFYRQLEGQEPRYSSNTGLSTLQTRLNTFLEQLAQKANSPIHKLRQMILKDVLSQADRPRGLFSLTVPTGGGKTFASMAFALDHALKQAKPLRRVIYVIPFTSIIEQNAKVFRDAFGEDLAEAVLEHHSAFDSDKLPSKDSKDKLRTAMENWDAPVVVTTAVQFFESLFADKTSKCRKLHNISGSVIILDEAQTLPLKFLKPIMAALDELARNYQCSIVFCTATQPALGKIHLPDVGFEDVHELVSDPDELFRQLRRTHLHNLGLQTDEQLIEQLSSREQVLMIVNNRRHARVLFDGIKNLPGARHLTTLMCAKHRSQVLNEIRADLHAGRPCRLVSTSLIEAGVDVDFPTVLRAEAGLDSIAQAAGRCNREGRYSVQESTVYIFRTDDEWKAPPELELFAGTMREVLRQYPEDGFDLLIPEVMTRYFKGVYWSKGEELDKCHILEKCKEQAKNLNFPFETIAHDVRLIESHLRPVIIPWNNEVRELLRRLETETNIDTKVGGIARGVQPYLVQIPEYGFKTLELAGVIRCIRPELFGEQFWVLDAGDLYEEFYQLDAGLSWDHPDFIKAEKLVI